MPLLNEQQLDIIQKLRRGRCRFSELKTSLNAQDLRLDLDAIVVAGVPLRMNGRWVEISKTEALLDAQRIYADLTAANRRLLTSQGMWIINSLGSTNEEIKRLKMSPAILLAEQQEKGRGRYGREWMSPFAAGIYLSLKWPRDSTARLWDGLSLAAGVMVATALGKLNIRCGLKWPNDLIVNEAKLGGILVDLTEEHIIIGAGINYAERAGDRSLQELWQRQGDKERSRNKVAACLINELLPGIPLFLEYGFGFFHSHWRSRDILMGSFVVVKNGTQTQGLCAGVNEQGALLVNVDGETRALCSGTLSV